MFDFHISQFFHVIIQGKGTMTTYWLEGQTDTDNPVPASPGGLSLSDFNALNIQPESERDGQSEVTSGSDGSEEETENEGPSPKYVSFLNMPSLPNAADLISNDSGLLELFDSEPEESSPSST